MKEVFRLQRAVRRLVRAEVALGQALIEDGFASAPLQLERDKAHRRYLEALEGIKAALRRQHDE